MANLDRQIGRAEAAVLKGADATMFVEEMKVWTERLKVLHVEHEAGLTASGEHELLQPDLSRV